MQQEVTSGGLPSIHPLEIPPPGTRGTGGSVYRFLMRIFRPMMAGQVARYRKAAGPNLPVMMGVPAVLLTTVGAQSRRPRTAVVGAFDDGKGGWLVVASAGGASTHPQWFINLAKHPDDVWLEVGRRKLKVRPTLLRGAEREAAFAKVVAIAPQYAGYQKKTDREIPIVRCRPV